MIIDVHHHFLPKLFFDEGERIIPKDMEAVWENGRVVYRYRDTKYAVNPPMDPTWWYDEDKQLRAMDGAGVDHAVVSVACYQDWMTIEAARIINDGTAQLVARHRDRFSGMLCIPPDGGEPMVEEIRRGKELGLCAINLTTVHRGRYLDHEDFRLLFETASALKLPVYVHPSWLTPLPNMSRWDLERAIGKPTDLNLSIANLMFSGRFNDLPDLKVLFAHMGGSLGVTKRRLFFGQKGWIRIPDYDYPELLKRVFVDTAPGMWWAPQDIEALSSIIGVEQMLLGSDYPLSFDPAEVLKIAVHNVQATHLSEESKRRIFGTNAIELFGLHHLEGKLADGKVADHQHFPGSGCCDHKD